MKERDVSEIVSITLDVSSTKKYSASDLASCIIPMPSVKD